MVSGYINEFVSGGLAIEPNRYYRFHKALFGLGELGIDLASLKKLEKPQKPKTLESESTTPVNQQKPEETGGL